MKTITRLFSIVVISFAYATAFAQPTVSAPTPPALSAGNVISVFSDAYTNVTGTDFYPNWSQATQYAPITIGSDNVLKYSNMNYQGIQIGSTQNCAAMKYLHLDVWTNDANAATFPIGIVWTGGEFTLTKTVATNGTWTSLDIPLSSFTGAVLSSVIQFKFQSNEWFSLGAAGSASNYTTVYLDNIYFWTDAAPDTQAPTAFTAVAGDVAPTTAVLKLNATDNSGAVNYTITYGTTVLNTSGVSGTEKDFTITGLTPATTYNFSVECKDAAGNAASNNPIVVPMTTASAIAASPTPAVSASNVYSIFSDAYTAAATNLKYSSWWNASWADVTLADAGNARMIVSTNGGGGGGLEFDNLDVSSMSYFHIDVYPTTATSSVLKYNVVPVGGGGTGWTAFSTLIPNQWNQIDIPISALGLPGTSVYQVGIGTFGGEGTTYIDNIYFYKSSTGINDVVATPMISCYPNPVVNQVVISAQSEMSAITICNLVGQSIKSEIVSGNTKTIDLSNIPAGNYIISVKLVNGKISTQKIVKL